MEHLNQILFLWINAVHPSSLDLQVGRVLANGLVYIYPLYLLVGWMRSDAAGREALLQGAVSAIIALFLSWAIARLWFHPRPFVIGLGQQYMPHEPTASFPSNHLSFIWGLCAGLYLHAARRRAAWILGLLGLPVAWARIYMGIHFPLDMAGALATGIIAALLSMPLRTHGIPQLRAIGEYLYRRLFAWPIRQGWIRS